MLSVILRPDMQFKRTLIVALAAILTAVAPVPAWAAAEVEHINTSFHEDFVDEFDPCTRWVLDASFKGTAVMTDSGVSNTNIKVESSTYRYDICVDPQVLVDSLSANTTLKFQVRDGEDTIQHFTSNSEQGTSISSHVTYTSVNGQVRAWVLCVDVGDNPTQCFQLI